MLMKFLFQVGYTLSQGIFELSSSENELEDMNTSVDNDGHCGSGKP